MTPERALAEIGGLFGGARVVSALAGGPASNSFLVARDADRWVLRIDTPVARQLGLDRGAEAAALGHADAHRVGPRLAFVDVEQGIQLTRFVAGRPWTPDDLGDPSKLARLADLLRTVHAIGPHGRPFALRQRVVQYAAAIGTAAAIDAADDVGALLDELGTRHVTLCHNDLVCANIVEGDDLRLIDWEYAAVGDPFFDLATVVEHHGLSDDAALHFLRAYSPLAGEAALRRLRDYRVVYSLLLELWQAVVDTIAPD